ncbi:MAG: sigma-54-dependent transcriptional regulator [Bacteriovoracia bacterium]
MPYKILMVDDDLKNIKATKGYLEINGYEVSTAQTSDEALMLVKKEEFALVLLDFQMPQSSGDFVAKLIREINPVQQVAMYSADYSRDALKLSYQAGAVEFIEKSSEPQDLLSKVRMYCNRYDELLKTIRPTTNKNENRRHLAAVKMEGQSQVMAEVAIKTKKIAEARDVSVLIHGESGTGKELVARALHDLSPRAKGPFVAINCAAIAKELLESTLFGHKKGSFTGAIADQDGKFIQADKGTIFLDEIGDLSLDLQAKLLRVLQERTVEPIGARLSRKIDVRIVCASHKKIDDLMKHGLFREDLMYRIKVAEIEIPPLRERVEDIEPLVAFFSEIYNKRYQTNRYFQSRAVDVLKKYPWPGNVRELAAVVEKHLVQTEGPLVRPEDLDLALYSDQDSFSPGSMRLSEWEEQKSKAKMSYILETIEASGSKIEAARRLGVTPQHLQYLLNQSKAAKLGQGTGA